MDYSYTEVLLAELDNLGLNNRELADACGLRLSELQQQENTAVLVETAIDKIGDTGLGLRLGRRLNLLSHGVVGYALMSSATIGDLLKVLIQYNRLLAPEMKFELHHQGDTVALRAIANGSVTRRFNRFAMESFFASVHSCAALLLPADRHRSFQQFHYPAPPYLNLYNEIYDQQVTFDAEASQLLMPATSLDIPLSMANPAAEVIFKQQCDALLSEYDKEKRVSARVMEELFDRRGDFPRCNQIAERLHMSESTLRRKLKAEGVTFQGVLDQVRTQLAYEYLGSTRLPVAEVARLLGFDDATNFRRSFRRWSGQTPSAYRDSL